MHIPRFSGLYQITGKQNLVQAVEAELEKQLNAKTLAHYSVSSFEGESPVIQTTQFVVGGPDMTRMGQVHDLNMAQQKLHASSKTLGLVGRVLMFVPVMSCSALMSAYAFLAQPRVPSYGVEAMMKHLERGTFNIETGHTEAPKP